MTASTAMIKHMKHVETHTHTPMRGCTHDGIDRSQMLGAPGSEVKLGFRRQVPVSAEDLRQQQGAGGAGGYIDPNEGKPTPVPKLWEKGMCRCRCRCRCRCVCVCVCVSVSVSVCLFVRGEGMPQP